MVDEDSHSTDLSARYLREGTFFIRGGGGGPGLQRGGSLVIFLQIERVKSVLFSTGGGSLFFLQGKNYSMSLLFCIYKQSYQSRLL